MVRSGLDRVAAGELPALAGKRIALLAHPASVTKNLVHAVDVLHSEGAEIVVLLGPEHGFGGEAQDMQHVDSSHFYGFGRTQKHAENKPGIRVVSLYGNSIETLTPKASAFDNVDVLVIDLQDVGSRYYTFVWTMALALRVAAARGVRTCILDRPNPLGGVVVEGKPQDAKYLSFVGLYALPIRHALTIGEIARFVACAEGISEDAFDVVQMDGWQRSMLFPNTGLPWIAPSPNMPTFDTALVYPGACLIEGTTLSEGRGTTKPFEQIGAPALDTAELVKNFPDWALSAASLRACTFVPTFQKHRGSCCNATFTHVQNPEHFRSLSLYAAWLAVAWRQRSEASFWRTEAYEYESSRLAIDLLAGGSELRRAVETGVEAVREWCHESVQPALDAHESNREFHLYAP